MTKLKIQVGKKYKTRGGGTVRIEYSTHPFASDGKERQYTVDGRYWDDSQPSEYDLVQEVIPPTEFKLQDGKTYVSRDGDITTVRFRSGYRYPFFSKDTGRSYTDEGVSWYGEKDPTDLIKEYTLAPDEVNPDVPETKDKPNKPKKISLKKFNKKVQEVSESWGTVDSMNFLNLTELFDDLRNELFEDKGE